MRQRATKEQIEEARRMAEEGRSPSAIKEATGVSFQTACALVRSIGEAPVTTRKMTPEEVAKYGPPKEQPQEEAKPKDEPERQMEIRIPSLPVGKATSEMEHITRALNFLHVEKVEITIKTIN